MCIVAVCSSPLAAQRAPAESPLEHATPLVVGHTLVVRPDLFDAAIAISPAITNDERVGEGQASLSQRMAAAFEDRESQTFSLFVTMSDGEDVDWETDLAAIEVFEYNLALYPESANVHDSLGETTVGQASDGGNPPRSPH